MKVIVIYGTTRGTTRRLVKRLREMLSFTFDEFNCEEEYRTLDNYNLYLFLCPTYGDKEPHSDIEQFLLKFDIDMRGKFFSACRIGTYEGYEFFEPSCGRIVIDQVIEYGGEEIVPSASIDSLPGVDLIAFDKWSADVDKWYQSNV